ncbi:peptidoglycan-binding protein, partial [Candidatus Kaiserbacteria bacterium]|nr:peptidoglycan-binding protein [Candidatus Kaiserbacteria bacterium]
QWMNASTTWPNWNYPPTAVTGTNASNSGSNSTNPPIPAMRFQRGMSGEHIKKIQQILASRNDGTFTADHVTGFFGPMTEEALKRFQANMGIDPLGFVGPQTLQRINEIITTSGLSNPSDNAQLQNAMDQFRQIQQDMSNGSSSNATFNLEHLRELLGRIQGLRQNIPSSPGQNGNPDWMNGCLPRPACLDATPRCMLPEPAGGWCAASNPQTPSTCGQIQCLMYQPVCGSDGQTYSCGAADANSCGVQVAHSGACQTNSDTNPPVACTMDAMMCPDGSYVGRTGPNCTFVCPTSSGNSR